MADQAKPDHDPSARYDAPEWKYPNGWTLGLDRATGRYWLAAEWHSDAGYELTFRTPPMFEDIQSAQEVAHYGLITDVARTLIDEAAHPLARQTMIARQAS